MVILDFCTGFLHRIFPGAERRIRIAPLLLFCLKENEIVDNARLLEYIHVLGCFGTIPRQIIAFVQWKHGRRYVLAQTV
jgi:hypothetical protein